MSEKRDRELDRIVGREKPGFQRVVARRSGATAPAIRVDGGTPDVAELQAKGDALGIHHAGARRGGRTRSSRALPSHHILTVRHARPDEADPLPSRVIVVSHKDRKIVGEQG